MNNWREKYGKELAMREQELIDGSRTNPKALDIAAVKLAELIDKMMEENK